MIEILFNQANQFKTEDTTHKETFLLPLIEIQETISIKFTKKFINRLSKNNNNNSIVTKRESFLRSIDKDGEHKNHNHLLSVKQNLKMNQ